MDAKRVIWTKKCTLSRENLTDFLRNYPIPQEFKIMLPTQDQSIFDAPKGYVGLYTHSLISQT